MSTKCTLKYGDGYHLYTDAADAWEEENAKEYVYLEIDRARVHISADDRGCWATVGMPIEIARKLGLLPPDTSTGEHHGKVDR